MVSVPRSPHIFALMASGNLKHASKGEMVSSSDEKQEIILVARGFIKRYLITNEGSLGTQIIYGPQDIFSLTYIYRELLDQNIYGGPEAYHYKAISDCQIYTLDSNTFNKAVDANPLLYHDLFVEAGHHLKNCVQRIENIAMANSYARLAHQLVFFARNYANKVDKGWQIRIPLTHQELADILSVTRETVSTSMSKLKKEGLIVTGRHIVVKDIARLTQVAYS